MDTKLNKENILKQIQTLREIKGKEKETYSLIDIAMKSAIESNDYETQVKLYWEESLVAQHEIMSEMTKDNNLQNKEVINKSKAKMEKAALNSLEVIKTKKLDKLVGTAYRFLGNVYRYKGDFIEAENYFIQAFTEYQNNKDKGTLEIRGFLAYCLIRNGELHNGIKLALETYDAFENSEKGKILKEKDYFTWAVWRSGIIPRIIEAIKENNNLNNKEINKKELNMYLDSSEEILLNPQGTITWGDSGFKLRLEEIKKAKEILNS